MEKSVKKKTKKKYYTRGINTLIKVEKRDKDGKPVIKKHPKTGEPMYNIRGEEVPVMIPVIASPLFVNPAKPTWGVIETDDSNIIAQLDLKDMDDNANVLSEKNYRKQLAPVEFDLNEKNAILEQENAVLQAKIAELTAVKADKKK